MFRTVRRLLFATIALFGGLDPAVSATSPAPAPAAPAPPVAAHDRAFWNGIREHDFAVPAGSEPGALLLELTELLGSPDPEVRDGLAYEIAAAWIYGKKTVSDADLQPAIALLEKNLTVGLGENGTPTVLRRSFSALVLSLVAARDNAAPFLTREGFDGLLSAAIDYLAREQDTRGFVAPAGWHHSVAHTADLLKFLGRNPKLVPADQRRILAGIALKAGGSTTFWSWGENDRLAAAVLSLLRREDADLAAFEAWVERFPPLWQAAWNDPLHIDPARYAAAKNGRDLLAALEVQVSLASPFPNADRAHAALRTALRRM